MLRQRAEEKVAEVWKKVLEGWWTVVQVWGNQVKTVEIQIIKEKVTVKGREMVHAKTIKDRDKELVGK